MSGVLHVLVALFHVAGTVMEAGLLAPLVLGGKLIAIPVEVLDKLGITQTSLRGCLKRVVPGIVRCHRVTKILNFAVIILLHRYSLRLSLAFQTTSKFDLLNKFE